MRTAKAFPQNPPVNRSSGDDTATDLKSQPHYRRIYEDIAGSIETGDLGYGAQLPLLTNLCSKYNVSEAPVRRALDELVRDGMIVRLRGRGKGTFVHKRIITPTVVRVLLLGFDLQYSAIEACHEAFGLVAGLQAAGAARGIPVHMVAENAIGSLAPASARARIGYAVIATTAAKYAEGERIARMQEEAPCVLINAPFAAATAGTIRVAMEEGGYLGAAHLARLGHRRIAYVGGTEGAWFAPRFAGYRRALATNGIEFDEDLVRRTNGIEAQEDSDALDALLALANPPTAIFACSDYRALHLMEHAQNRLNLSIPGDISLCGYDDIGACETVRPTLTTVHHPLLEQGDAAVALLLSLLDGTKPGFGETDIVLAPRLAVRESTAPR